MHLATFVFALTYILISMGENSPRKLDRPTAALFGAVLMVMTGSLTRTQAMAAIDMSTIALLFGMMVLLAVLIQSHLPAHMAFKMLRRCRNPHHLLAGTVFVSGVASAFMLNDTVCLLGTPIILEVVTQAGLPAAPFLLALATASNIGSAMTLTGNPQNVIIGQLSHWGWSPFFIRIAPISIVCLAVNWLVLHLMFRRQLSGLEMNVQSPQTPEIEVRRKLAVRSMIMFGAFIAAIVCGVPMDFAAVAAAIVLLVWANRPPKLAFNTVDWSLLLFFAGLFVVVEGLVRADRVALDHYLSTLGTGTSASDIAGWSAATVVGSNIFSNVPFVLLVAHWIRQMSNPMFMWLILSLTSTFAGNLTLFGSVANVIVAQRSQQTAPLSFWDFLRVGVPVTITTTAVGVAMLWGLHALGWA